MNNSTEQDETEDFFLTYPQLSSYNTQEYYKKRKREKVKGGRIFSKNIFLIILSRDGSGSFMSLLSIG